MDFFSIGNVSGYAKNLDMKAKWNKKKKKGDFQSESKKSDLQRKNDAFKDYWYKKKNDPENDEKMQSISNKVAAGKELTPDEMRYLEEKNPMLYKKIQQDKEEQKAFERDLRRCRTKDEVERLKTDTVAKSLTVIGSVKSDPNIPEGTKASIAASEMMKLKKLEEISAKFVKSGEYAKLPTEAEVRKAEKEIAEAQEAAREKAADTGTDTEETISGEEKTAEPQTSERESAEKADDAKAYKENRTVPHEEKTVTEAEASPEAQKMKRAKAKKVYIDIKKTTDSSTSAPYIANAFSLGLNKGDK